VQDLLRFVAALDIPLALGNSVTDLTVEDGAVTGAMINGEHVAARKVLLATNGFAADQSLVAEYCPEIAGADYYGAPGSTGEAVRWGRELGAALGNMGAYQGYAAVAYPQGQLLSWTTIEKGGILVSRDGNRFGAEDAGYSGFTPAVMAQGGVVWAVFDARIHDIAMQEEEYAEMAAMGALRWADAPEALAEAAGLDPTGLAETVASYNAAAAGTVADRFGRRNFGGAPLRPPFACATVKPGLFHTQGGLLVDEQARVRSNSGGIIGNLFAGGGAAAGISGRVGAAGYASGNGLVTALALGRIAGQCAAAELAGGA
jgi:fumarate reductase flavoprotein subunit